jgi:retron-type reverse transcriptase
LGKEVLMSWNPRRRGAHGVAGVRARHKPADLHEGSREDFLRRHEQEAARAARGTKRQKAKFASCLLRRVADHRTLRLAWGRLVAEGGHAPGVDGVRPDDLEDHGVWSWIRAVSTALRNGTYSPDRDRRKDIPKGPGRGTRPLSIPTLFDRVVQKAIVLIVQPFLDPGFTSRSFGWRPKEKGRADRRLQALARAERLAVETDRWVWLAEDLRDAFNHVPRQRLLDVVRLWLPDKGIMGLVERIVTTGTGKGIRQGGPFSPLLLHLYLHHLLDRRWGNLHPDLPLLRFGDDLLVLGRTEGEALGARKTLEKLLKPAGMTLKAQKQPTVRDLATGDHADWLGFRLRRGEKRPRARLTEETTWTARLLDGLARAHEEPDAPIRARGTILGWVEQQGPAYPEEDVSQVHAMVKGLALSVGLEEAPSEEELRGAWKRSHDRWTRARDAEKGEGAQEGLTGPTTP